MALVLVGLLVLECEWPALGLGAAAELVDGRPLWPKTLPAVVTPGLSAVRAEVVTDLATDAWRVNNRNHPGWMPIEVWVVGLAAHVRAVA